MKKPGKAASQERSVTDAGVALLARRDHFTAELRTKLRQRDFSPEEVEQFLQYAESRGWLDDRKCAEKYVNEQVRRGGHGRYWVKAKLELKGVSGDLAGEVLRILWDDALERALAQATLDRRGTQGENNSRKEACKLYGMLVRRGFDRAIVADLLRDWTSEEEAD